MAINKGTRNRSTAAACLCKPELSLLVLVLCLFLPAGTWAWSRGWLFLVVLRCVVDPMTLYLRRVNPDVIAGRVNRHEGTETLGSAPGADRCLPTDAGDPDRGSPGRRALPLVPRAVVGLRAGLLPSCSSGWRA